MPWLVFYTSVLFPMLVFLLIAVDELWPSDSAQAPAILKGDRYRRRGHETDVSNGSFVVKR